MSQRRRSGRKDQADEKLIGGLSSRARWVPPVLRSWGAASVDLPLRPRRRCASPPRLAPAIPADSGIDHVILVMMENRSFDHFLGWLPGADGRQAGLSYRDPNGRSHRTFHQSQLNGCGFNDPDHSYSGGRIQYNGGSMDGFLTDSGQRLVRHQLLPT